MKKFFSILLALLVLVSGVHLSVSAHICGGQVAAVKWSLSGQNATCGMETDATSTLPENSVSTDCCHNILTFFAVDHNYQNSDIQVLTSLQPVGNLFAAEVLAFNYLSTTQLSNTIFSPPGDVRLTDVSLPYICVFRI
jgi:hypothetical protein